MDGPFGPLGQMLMQELRASLHRRVLERRTRQQTWASIDPSQYYATLIHEPRSMGYGDPSIPGTAAAVDLPSAHNIDEGWKGE
jgi:hypothetical protein